MLTSSACDSANQSSAAQVALMIFSYVQKTFIFSAHSAVACSEDCPWDTHMTPAADMHRANTETQADPRIRTHMHTHGRRADTNAHTLDSFTVRDK